MMMKQQLFPHTSEIVLLQWWNTLST